mmetsp:Transcript_784/g.800  ORF Transcript_784/g.800 Transcript_784/m.800 type:complete len:107 (+) Transcript_784:3-323(+)
MRLAVFYRPTVSMEVSATPISDRAWRKGHYTKPRWKRSFPQQDKQNTLIDRHMWLQEFDVESEQPNGMIRKLEKYHESLTKIKARKLRHRQAVKDMDSSSSSSSSS